MCKVIFYRYYSRARNTIYHFRVADYKKLKEYSNCLGLHFVPWLKILQASWKNGASFEDYFELKFFNKSPEQRNNWLTASLRHELTRQVNNPYNTLIFKDKLSFSRSFAGLLGRKIYDWPAIRKMAINEDLPNMVLKPRLGQAGEGIFITEKIKTFSSLCEFIKENNINPDGYVYEKLITNQHSVLEKIYPGSLNTIRIMSFYDGANVEIWGCFLRIGINSNVDTFATGGIAASIQIDGTIEAPAVSKNPFDGPYYEHPVTKEKIVGIKIPFWDETMNLVNKAVKIIPDVKSIGWDVAITKDGPCLMEGNDNWCKTILQIPTSEGKRYLADEVADMKAVYD